MNSKEIITGKRGRKGSRIDGGGVERYDGRKAGERCRGGSSVHCDMEGIAERGRKVCHAGQVVLGKTEEEAMMDNLSADCPHWQ